MAKCKAPAPKSPPTVPAAVAPSLAPAVTVTHDGDGFLHIGGTAEAQALMQKALGTNSDAAIHHFTSQIINATANRQTGAGADHSQPFNATLAFLSAIDPSDEVETALGLQMYATHNLAMETARRATLNMGHNVETAAAYVGMNAKLGRTFVAQLEALAKLRSAGKQVIEVQHVHVYPGGQAVVGDIHRGGKDEG